MGSLTDTMAATVARHTMLPDGCPILAMVSGGGDSVALLHLLARGVLGEHPLRVLHVNHLLRGADSDADERFVRGLCDELGVECRVVRFEVAPYAESERLNLEDAGRRVRSRFAADELDAWCVEAGLTISRGRIAIAHTLDDRVETFFMRAIAGAGSGALGSIAPTRGRIVRPLIEVSRDEVRSWLLAEGLEWREDATNADTDRTRALIRAQIVPAAESLNPSFRASLARTMNLLADDDALLSAMAGSFARDFAAEVNGRLEFARDLMRTLDRTMARRTVRAALVSAFPEASRLEAAHVEALVDGMAVDGFARDLPEGLRAENEYGTMVVSRTGERLAMVAPGLLTVPGIADLGEAGEIVAQIAPVDDTTGGPDTVVIDAGAVGAELTVDGPRPGDRIRPLGMDGSRKLSDLLVDAKVPRRMRGAVPVVRDGDRIVWVAGIRMSEDYRVGPDTRDAVRLTWRRNEDVAR